MESLPWPMTPSRTDTAGSISGPARVVFFGTPEFAVPVLRALVEAPGVEVRLVVTQPDRPAGRGRRLTASPVKVFAQERATPVFQPERLRGAEALERLRAAGADLFVIAAYGQILRQAVLDIPPHGCLNVHPSLLPRHRGPAPVAAAILAGDEATGATIMLTEQGLDTGPILTQRRVPLERRETTASLTPKLFTLGADLLLETIPRWLAGEIVPRPQDERLATVSRLFARGDGALDWSRPAIELERQVRALNPWPHAYTFWDGRRLLLLAAHALEDRSAEDAARAAATDEDEPPAVAADAAPSGTVAADSEGRMIVATGDGALRVDELQPEGRRAIDSTGFLRANPAILGTRLRTGPPADGRTPAADHRGEGPA